MTPSLLRFVVLGLLLVGCARPTTKAPCWAPFTEQDRQAVEAVLAAQSEAWNRGDLEGYMQGYVRSPNLVFTSGSKVRTGFDETLASYSKKYGQSPETMGKLQFQIMRVDPIGESGAVVLGRWDLALATGPVGGIFTVVVARRPEGWRIIHDHTSSDPPPL